MNRRGLSCLLEVFETIVLTLVIYLVVQTFVAEPHRVDMTSMEPTLEPGQLLLIDKLSPQFSDYKQGDIVVFNAPTELREPGGTRFIKRVIGVAGDTVAIRDNHVYVNGKMLVEPYVYKGQPTWTADGESQTWTIKPGELFVLGDHRENSQDSRYFGPIQKSAVVGRAVFRYWPLDKLGVVPGDSQPAASPSASPTGSPQGSTSADDAAVRRLVPLPPFGAAAAAQIRGR